MLNVNPETVRRWIREEKLCAEKGSGRQGSKVSSENIMDFLDKNRSLITENVISELGVAASVLGVTSMALNPFMAPVTLASSIVNIIRAKDKVNKKKEEELKQKKIEVEEACTHLDEEILCLQNQLQALYDQKQFFQDQLSLITKLIDIHTNGRKDILSWKK